METTNQERVTAIKNADLAQVCFQSKKSDRTKLVSEKIELLLGLPNYTQHQKNEIATVSRLFCMKFNDNLNVVSRNRTKFNERFDTWLQQQVKLPDTLQAKSDQIRVRGRPKKPFEEASSKTKKRRVADLMVNRTSEELQFAAKTTANTTASPSASLTPHETLALYMDLDLSESKYKILRSVVNAVHPNCFPSLYQLNNTKNALLPSLVTATETSAEVDLNELLQITAKSLIKIAQVGSNQLKLVCKWGFDGSSGHSQYKQIFTNELSTDEYLFLIAMVPLKLIIVNNGREVWANPTPSSTLYCRPIKFLFQKENPELVRNEEKKMQDQINDLQVIEVALENGQTYSVICEMLFTMMDGSVSNTLSNTNATARCINCGAAPKEMNSAKVFDRQPNVEIYRFGLSTLHCWIRFFECLLHIAYRLPIKSWQIRGKESKDIVDNNKKRIQAEFKSKMGLLVDKPKPGYGSTNDGNTARRFFSNPNLSSEITGIDRELIAKFATILGVLSSRNNINLNKFKMLLNETWHLYIGLYEWYYMPSTVHKVLVHGCDIISAFSLPIGQLSEDALEARHKEVRKQRLSHTRKRSRISTNFDLMRRLLLTSEPFLSSKRKIITKKGVRMDNDVQQYIIQTQEPSAIDNLGVNLDLDLQTSDDSSDSD